MRIISAEALPQKSLLPQKSVFCLKSLFAFSSTTALYELVSVLTAWFYFDGFVVGVKSMVMLVSFDL